MVLTQRTSGAGKLAKVLLTFPYHYGSYKSSPPLTVQEHGPVLR